MIFKEKTKKCQTSLREEGECDKLLKQHHIKGRKGAKEEYRNVLNEYLGEEAEQNY